MNVPSATRQRRACALDRGPARRHLQLRAWLPYIASSIAIEVDGAGGGWVVANPISGELFSAVGVVVHGCIPRTRHHAAWPSVMRKVSPLAWIGFGIAIGCQQALRAGASGLARCRSTSRKHPPHRCRRAGSGAGGGRTARRFFVMSQAPGTQPQAPPGTRSGRNRVRLFRWQWIPAEQSGHCRMLPLPPDW